MYKFPAVARKSHCDSSLGVIGKTKPKIPSPPPAASERKIQFSEEFLPRPTRPDKTSQTLFREKNAAPYYGLMPTTMRNHETKIAEVSRRELLSQAVGRHFLWMDMLWESLDLIPGQPQEGPSE